MYTQKKTIQHFTPGEDCDHWAFRAYATPNVTAVDRLSGNAGDAWRIAAGEFPRSLIGIIWEKKNISMGSKWYLNRDII